MADPSDVPQPTAPRLWAVAALLAAPMVGLAVLLARPDFDVAWEHQPSHFWLVLLTAAVSVALAYVTNEAAGRRRDARLLLISLAFLASAGFLGLHALATPGVLLADSNVGFAVATPVGLAIASGFAAVSTSALGGPRAAAVLRHGTTIRRALVALMLAWAAVSLAQLPPLSGDMPAREAAGPLIVLALIGVPLFAFSAWRSYTLYRHRGSLLALAIAAALVLLAEAMVAVALSRNWHLSWWEWHVLMALAFGAIALGARAEYRRTRSLTGTFGGLYLDATLARVNRWHARAIADIAAVQERGEPTDRLLAELRREGASSDELRLLEETAGELARMNALFHPYLPSQVAARLRREPDLARLGGEERVVTVLFADLAGFTAFSEDREPAVVIHMLNTYWEAVVPVIDDAGGLIEHFAGDGVMVIFNAVSDQPDHAVAAAGTGLRMIDVTDPLAAGNPGWPRFRVGVNTGAAVVGNVGAAGRRTFGAIGDTSNLGARLMSAGEPGQVVISRSSREAITATGRQLRGTALGRISVKGKREPVEAWVVEHITSS